MGGTARGDTLISHLSSCLNLSSLEKLEEKKKKKLKTTVQYNVNNMKNENVRYVYACSMLHSFHQPLRYVRLVEHVATLDQLPVKAECAEHAPGGHRVAGLAQGARVVA